MKNLNLKAAAWYLFTSTKFIEAASREAEETAEWFGTVGLSRRVSSVGRNNQLAVPQTVAVEATWHPVIPKPRNANASQELWSKAGQPCPKAGMGNNRSGRSETSLPSRRTNSKP